MKLQRLLILLAFVLFLSVAVLIACDDDDDDDDDNDSGATDDDDNNDSTGDDDDNDSAGDDDDNDDGISVGSIDPSDCKDSGKSKTGSDIGWLEFDYAAGVLTVTHYDTYFNCCYESVDVSVQLSGFELSIYEQEVTPDPCFCMCHIDLTYEIEGLASGTYTVTAYVNGDYGTQNEVTLP
jgi:hypothetical protein